MQAITHRPGRHHDPIWPWLAGAAGLWALLVPTVANLPAQTTALVGAVAITLCAAMIRRRNNRPRVSQVTEQAGALDHPRRTVLEVPCPCGCRRFVADDTGWLTAMTAWVQACHDLVADAVQRGTRGASLELFERDTAQVLELLLSLCHRPDDMAARWSVNGVVRAWDLAWRTHEHVMARAIGRDEFGEWRTRTEALRRDRHGYLSGIR